MKLSRVFSMGVPTISTWIHRAHTTTSPFKTLDSLLVTKWISTFKDKYLKCNIIGDRWIQRWQCIISRNKSRNKYQTKIGSQITIRCRASKCQGQILALKTTILQDSVKKILYFRIRLQYQKRFWMNSQECLIKQIVWLKLTTKDHFSNNRWINQTRTLMNRMKVS